MRGNSLFDTGYLYAYLDQDDAHHPACVKTFSSEIDFALLPDVVLPELAHLVLRGLNVAILAEFLRAVAKGDFVLVNTTVEDLRRAAEILERYNDNNIDLVDAVIVAMAERLDITRILTIDRRHFGAFRPAHCEAFEILP